MREGQADPNAHNSWNTTILQIAIDRGRERIARILLGCNAVDLNFRDNDGKTMLMRLIETYVDSIKDMPATMTNIEDKNLLDDMNHTLQHLLTLPKLRVGIADAS
eukprot:980850-Ditylum_brightwellii.AAC.1